MSGFFLNLDLHFKSKEKASWKFQLVLSSYTKPIHLLTHLHRERERQKEGTLGTVVASCCHNLADALSCLSVLSAYL